VAAGAGHEGPALRVHDSVQAGCLGMDAYAFGNAAGRLQRALAPNAAARNDDADQKRSVGGR